MMEEEEGELSFLWFQSREHAAGRRGSGAAQWWGEVKPRTLLPPQV